METRPALWQRGSNGHHNHKKSLHFLVNCLKNFHTVLGSWKLTSLKKLLNCPGLGRQKSGRSNSKRPFNVVKSTEKDRQFCLCKTHENCSLLATCLKQLKLIPTAHLPTLVKLIVCDVTNRECCFSLCDVCKLKLAIINPHFENEITSWFQWVSVTKENGSKISEKQKIVNSVIVLMQHFETALRKIAAHNFKINNQFCALKKLKDNLKPHELIVHCDFSENFTCKYFAEIQSAHFGASNKTVSLHTVMLYASNTNPVPICTISENCRHDSIGVLAHLRPIFQYIKDEFPEVNVLHILSDSPSSQYRNKNTLYLFLHEILQVQNFKWGTWNFFEAGHGKGAPDGIGSVIKRHADRLVNNGDDVMCALDLYNKLNGNTAVNLIFVHQDNFEIFTKILSDLCVQPIPNIMTTHQVLCSSTSSIHLRELSCFCKTPLTDCLCFKWISFTLNKKQSNDKQCKSDVQKCVTNVPTVELVKNIPFSEGQWVAVPFTDAWYPAIVISKLDATYRVKFMHPVCHLSKYYKLDDLEQVADIAGATVIKAPVVSAHSTTRKTYAFDPVDMLNISRHFGYLH